MSFKKKKNHRHIQLVSLRSQMMKVLIVLAVLATVALCCDRPAGENEHCNSCASPCGDGCINHILGLACIQSCAEKPTVTCVGNYARNPLTGKCVKSEECPGIKDYNYCRGKNEVAKIPNRCGDRCGEVPCEVFPYPDMKPECGCAEGYCRNTKGICVRHK